jgi:hypothetical protein
VGLDSAEAPGLFRAQIRRFLFEISTLKLEVPLEKSEYAKRCYYHVFLHVIRNHCKHKSIDSKQLERLARREFLHMCTGSQMGHVDEQNEAAHFGSLVSLRDPDEVTGNNRHGLSLFKDSAQGCLYLDCLLEPCQHSNFVSRSFLVTV